MKKIMIALAVVAMAACSQAANWVWTNSDTSLLYAAGDSTKTVSGLMYIFANGSQSDVFDAWYNEGSYGVTTLSDSLHSKNITDGWLGEVPSTAEFSTANTGNKQYFFAAIIKDGDLFISSTASKAETDMVGGNTISFSFKTKSQATPFEGKTAYDGAGWYTAAVPEPTSGLLFLLGVAGLALRRRHA